MARQARTRTGTRVSTLGRGVTALGAPLSRLGKRGVHALASAVIAVTTLAALVLALHVVFAIFDANNKNGIVTFVGNLADILAWQFQNLFLLPKQGRLEVLINFGIAAAAYLFAGRLVAAALRRLS